MVPIVADAVNSQIGNRYATYAALDKAVRPIYTAHGLRVTFTTGERSTDIAVEVSAYLCGHGHGRRYSIVMPADGKGARGGDVMTRTHAAASAISYGMRYLSVMIWNLAIDKDDDGNGASALPVHKSSAALKREGVWQTFEGEMRAAASLQGAGDRVRALAAAHPTSGPRSGERLPWSSRASRSSDSAGRCGSWRQSAQQIDDDHDQDRWRRNLQDSPGRW